MSSQSAVPKQIEPTKKPNMVIKAKGNVTIGCVTATGNDAHALVTDKMKQAAKELQTLMNSPNVNIESEGEINIGNGEFI